MLHAMSLGLTLVGLWLLLSGIYNPLLLSLGAFTVALIMFIAHRMDVIDREGHPIHITLRALLYWPWLIIEIIKANIDVAKIVAAPTLKTGLCQFTCIATQKSELGRVVYANSITLTPGTVTIGVDDEHFTIHALTYEGRDGVLSGEMDQKCTAMENELAGTDDPPYAAGPQAPKPDAEQPKTEGKA